MRTTISVKGARTNNLKNIDIEIPRDKLTIVTGVSGSGKTSLAFDVIFGEGQRKFFESMSASSRALLPMLERADVDSIVGLSPVVAIQQRVGVQNPRSTVGTLTDIHNYLRLMYSVLGQAHCPYCMNKIETRNANQLVDYLMTLPEGSTIEILAPVFKFYDEDYQYLFDHIRDSGYRRVRINGEENNISENMELDEEIEYKIEVVIDKFIIKKDLYKQLGHSIENANFIGAGFICFEILGEKITEQIKSDFYKGFGCKEHHMIMHHLMPNAFSPNVPDHSCPTCFGVGTYLECEPRLLVVDENKSINKKALSWVNRNWLYTLKNEIGLDPDIPFKDIPEDIKHKYFFGIEEPLIFQLEPDDNRNYISRYEGKAIKYRGLVNSLNRYYRNDRKKGERYEWYRKFMAEHICPDCKGKKLKNQRFLVTIDGKDIHELGNMFIDELLAFVKSVNIPKDKEKAGKQIIYELQKRIQLLIDIGLYYLRLDRRASTLSGGEGQRVKLSTQLGSELMGMLYVLDEPSIGLHQRDTNKIIDVLKRLRDFGNTVIVIEHDLETIKKADNIIEMGPGPGSFGGEIVVHGEYKEVLQNPNFITGHFITGKKKIPRLKSQRESNGKTIKIIGAAENNLKNIDVEIPLGLFVCITGVSGSGKSTLIEDILSKKLEHEFRDLRIQPGKHERIEGIENIKDIRLVDQTPIGKTSRSIPATYIGMFNKIRRVFADTQDAKDRGYKFTNFSYNTMEGRCGECNGEGEIKIELNYMPSIRSICPVCKGERYSSELLEVKYKGKSIGEVLNLSFEEAFEFFKDIKLIRYRTKVLNELGLGYLKLGQPAPSLSGGESQRIKLAKELGKMKRRKDNLYVLDEPTVGLHMEDIQKLLKTIHRLVDEGNTVIVVEHHLDVIKSADYIIDLGPEGGAEGGYIVAEGTVEEIANNKKSYTGQFLKEVL